jgi:hypothetical protein
MVAGYTRVVASRQLSALNITGRVAKAMCVTRRDVSLKLPIKLWRSVQYLKLDDFSSASCRVHEFLRCRSSFGQFHHLYTDAPKCQEHITIILLVCDLCHDKIIMLCLTALHSTTLHLGLTHTQLNCTSLCILCTTATCLKCVCKMDLFNNFVSFHASLANKWEVNELFTDFKKAYKLVSRECHSSVCM